MLKKLGLFIVAFFTLAACVTVISVNANKQITENAIIGDDCSECCEKAATLGAKIRDLINEANDKNTCDEKLQVIHDHLIGFKNRYASFVDEMKCENDSMVIGELEVPHNCCEQ